MSYCKRFANNLSPDRMGCLMILHYDGGLNQRERDKLTDDLCKSCSNASIYIGRMNLLQNSVPKNLPSAAREIYKYIRMNSVMVFGPPCCGWWFQMVHTIEDLGLYRKGKFFADEFFAGYCRIPTDDIFRYLDAAAVCPDPTHPIVGLEHMCKPRSLPAPDHKDVSPETSTLLEQNIIGHLNYAVATRLPGENQYDIIGLLDYPEPSHWPRENQDMLLAQKRFCAKLRATITGLLQPAYSCISFEIARALHFLSALGLSTFITTSVHDTFTELAEELLHQIQHFESAQMMNVLVDLWDGGFLERCNLFLSAFSPDFVEHIGTVFRNCLILSPDLNFSRRLLELVVPGRSVQQPLLRRVTRMLIALDAYMDSFEKPFFENLAILYAEELSTVIANVDDLDSWSSCLADASSRLELVAILRKVLLANESDYVVMYLLEGSINEDISSSLVRVSTVFQALSRSAVGSMVFHTWVQGCIDCSISTFPQDPSCNAEPVHLIEGIITAARNCKLAIESHLHSNFNLLQYSSACVACLLNGSERYAEYISLFIDAKIREGPEGFAATGDAIALVDLLESKDLFEGFYLKHLARRLAHGQSGLELESLMILNLYASTSIVFALKADLLIDDAWHSADVMQNFEVASTSLSVVVFDCRPWPLSSQTCRMPADIVQEAELFENHYREAAGESENRLLRWLADLGSAVIQCSFLSGTHNIQVSTLEMLILLLFNESDCLSSEDIEKATGFPLSHLQKPLEALWERSILLINTRNGLTWFSVNEDYTPHQESAKEPKLELCTPYQSVKEPKLEFVETLAAMEANRRYAIDAAVVRLLKAHKRILHSELIASVVEALRPYFVADVGQIKGRIESLMEGEYLERDSDNPELYLYLA